MRLIPINGSNKKMRIYIRGSYGPANIGDDLLLHVTLKLLDEAFEKSEFFTSFVDSKLGEEVFPQVKAITKQGFLNAEFDCIVHGGGGQFFSFSDSAKKALDPLPLRIVKRLFSVKGRKRILGGIRSLTYGKKEFQAVKAKRVGIGMGVGPFAKGSRRENEGKNILTQMEYLTVRDEKSLAECTRLIGGDKATLASDLSLYRRLWISPERLKEIRQITFAESKPIIAICMRSWHQVDLQDEICENLGRFVKQSEEAGYEVVALSVCGDSDEHWLKDFPSLRVLTYTPSENGIEDYLSELKRKVSLIISGRAHVTILSSQVGIPTISIPLERKLYWANGLRGREQDMWSPSFSAEELLVQADDVLNNRDAIIDAVCEELDSRSQNAEEEIDGVIDSLKSVFSQG